MKTNMKRGQESFWDRLSEQAKDGILQVLDSIKNAAVEEVEKQTKAIVKTVGLEMQVQIIRFVREKWEKIHSASEPEKQQLELQVEILGDEKAIPSPQPVKLLRRRTTSRDPLGDDVENKAFEQTVQHLPNLIASESDTERTPKTKDSTAKQIRKTASSSPKAKPLAKRKPAPTQPSKRQKPTSSRKKTTAHSS